jgi:hypothetical protein
MSIYVYCLSDELNAEMVEGLDGLSGVQVRLLSCGGVASVVSDYGDARVAATAENVRAHNSVNARLLARATPLPFRFGTVIGEERLADYVARHEGSIRATLERVRGCVEMSVKVLWDAAAARIQVEAEHDSGRGDTERESAGPVAHADEGAGAQGQGTAFLLARRRELLGGEALRRRAEEVAAWLAVRVSGLARESSVILNPSGSLVVRAEYLVEKEHVPAYQGRVRGLGAERPDLRFLTSGAWPPYSFSNLRD